MIFVLFLLYVTLVNSPVRAMTTHNVVVKPGIKNVLKHH